MTSVSRRRLLRGLGLASLGVVATIRGSRTAMAVSDWEDSTLSYSSSDGELPAFQLSSMDISFDFSYSNFPSGTTTVDVQLDARSPSHNYESIFTGSFTAEEERNTRSIDGTTLNEGAFPVDLLAQESISKSDFTAGAGETKTTDVDFLMKFSAAGEETTVETTCTVAVTNTSSEILDSEANQKLSHRWLLDDVNGSIEDSVGAATGTNNGVVSVSGDYVGGSAGDGGSTSNIDTTTLGSFGSKMDSDFALAFTMKSSSSSLMAPMGVFQGTDGQYLYPSIGPVANVASGELAFQMGDSNYTQVRVYSDGLTYNDGSLHRVVMNKTANDASGLDIWVDQTQVSTTTERDEGFSTTADFTENWQLFAYSNSGSSDLNWEGVLDDLCLFSDSLTQSEIESYQNPWQ